MVVEQNEISTRNFNEQIFKLASKLDKCIYLSIACGFNLSDLLQEPKENQYIIVISSILEKLRNFAAIVQRLSGMPASAEQQKLKEIFMGEMKSVLKQLSEIQNSEALIFYQHIGVYVEILA